ncbi:MAG: DUF4912 domain-containing protein [Treponema sp.]|nr:DUF4912 domain-containing protein [Treponema sp.]MCL2271744.1 DUF4912 domain-containing protein [Treponema sp.]
MAKDTHEALSRTRLETLSTDELLKLSDSYGMDIPDGLERIFIIEELLECSNYENQETVDDMTIDLSYPETAALPKQYNISFIEVIIRDPLWVFVYWEIKSHDREIHEKANNFNGYCLRIVSLDEEEGNNESENSFTVPVGAQDCARYIGLAEHSPQTQGRYIIKLEAVHSDSKIQVAASSSFCLPKLIENENINSMKENPLLRLSAVADLSIIKNIDRQARNKRL